VVRADPGCARPLRVQMRPLEKGRQTRIARICGMARVVDHFLPAVRSSPLDARQSWRARGIAVEAAGRGARDSPALSRTRKGEQRLGRHAADLAHQRRRSGSICGLAHMGTARPVLIHARPCLLARGPSRGCLCPGSDCEPRQHRRRDHDCFAHGRVAQRGRRRDRWCVECPGLPRRRTSDLCVRGVEVGESGDGRDPG
jgi:hypothetical protein